MLKRPTARGPSVVSDGGRWTCPQQLLSGWRMVRKLGQGVKGIALRRIFIECGYGLTGARVKLETTLNPTLGLNSTQEEGRLSS